MVLSWESQCSLWFLVRVRERKVEMLTDTAAKPGEHEIQVHLKTSEWRCPRNAQPT